MTGIRNYQDQTRSQIPFGNALVREVALRNLPDRYRRLRSDFNNRVTLQVDMPALKAKDEIQFQERARSQMEFGNEKEPPFPPLRAKRTPSGPPLKGLVRLWRGGAKRRGMYTPLDNLNKTSSLTTPIERPYVFRTNH